VTAQYKPIELMMVGLTVFIICKVLVSAFLSWL